MKEEQVDRMQADFIDDFTERLTNLAGALERIDPNRIQEDFPVDLVFRMMHSLKGTAGMFGLDAIGEIAASIEAILTEVRRGSIKPDSQLLGLVIEAIDEMIAQLGQAKIGQPAGKSSQLPSRLRSFMEASQAPPQSQAAQEARNSQLAIDQEGQAQTLARTQPDDGSRSVPSKDQPQDHTPDLSVKIQINTLDSIIQLISDLRSIHIAIANAIRELPALSENRRLRSRLLKASIESRKSVSELQRILSMARLVPASTLFERFRVEVRRLARMVGKEVELVIEGGETRVDRAVLERLYDPILHIIRNSVAHGIETPQERRAAGKPTKGKVIMRAGIAGNQIRIEVEDDGRGIDKEKIAAIAQQFGMDSQEGQGVFDLLFLPGFTTCPQADQICGRGVGLDAVRSEVEKLRGTVRLRSDLSKGTTVSLLLPLTMVVSRGLLIEDGGLAFIIPDSDVIQVVKIPDAAEMADLKAVDMGDLRIIRLGSILGTNAGDEPKFVTFVSAGDEKLGLLASNVIGEIDIVSKPLPQVLSIPGYVDGVAELGDGRAGLILNTGLISSNFEAAGFDVKSQAWVRPNRDSIAFLQEADELELVVFRNGKSYYAVLAGLVKEIVRSIRPTPLPSSGPGGLALGFIRGQCHLLCRADDQPLNTQHVSAWVISLRVPANCGLIADKVEQIVKVSRAAISSKLEPLRSNPLVEVVANLTWQKQDVSIVDLLGTLKNMGGELAWSEMR